MRVFFYSCVRRFKFFIENRISTDIIVKALYYCIIFNYYVYFCLVYDTTSTRVAVNAYRIVIIIIIIIFTIIVFSSFMI